MTARPTQCPSCFNKFQCCSECGFPRLDTANITFDNKPHYYCPNCGAVYSGEHVEYEESKDKVV